MKKLLPVLAMIFWLQVRAQQSSNIIYRVKTPDSIINVQKEAPVRWQHFLDSGSSGRRTVPKKVSSFSFEHIKAFGLYGLGNLNGQSEEEINASGKLSGFIRPYRGRRNFVNFNFSYNRNADNTDSLYASTFLFPDVGNSSFVLGIEYNHAIGISSYKQTHLLAPFFELSSKTVEAKDDGKSLNFNSYNYVAGIKYLFNYHDYNGNNELENTVGLSVSPFFAVNSVPDEDRADYKELFDAPALKPTLMAVGVKTMFQYNSFGVFVDIRHVLGNEKDIPINDLRGIKVNVGFLFNAKVVEW